MKITYQRWSRLPYAGEKEPPTNPEEPLAGSWKLFFLKRDAKGNFLTPNKKLLKLNIKNPNTIDWNNQLKAVLQTLNAIDYNQIEIARYWGTGVATKQWTPIIDILIDTYGVSAPRAARILASIQASLNDTFVVVWNLKFKWDVARPNQLDHDLATITCTPRHPTYPSGHATVAGCASTILTYFFPAESERLEELAQECAISRLYGGVHFPIDNNEGLQLGRQLGHIIVNNLKRQKNSKGQPIDIPYTTNKNAQLIPPPYQQAIPFNFDMRCTSKIRDVWY